MPPRHGSALMRLENMLGLNGHSGGLRRIFASVVTLFCFVLPFLTTVTAQAQGIATISNTDQNNGSFTTPGGIGGTLTITNRTNVSGASGIYSTTGYSGTNFPGTWYSGIPVAVVANNFKFMEVNNLDGASTGSFRMTISFGGAAVTNPVLLFANIDAGRYDFSGTTTTSGGAVQLQALSGNSRFGINNTTKIVNSTQIAPWAAGCQAADGSNPSGGCGAVQLTGTYTSITYIATDMILNTGQGDGHALAIYIPPHADLSVTKTVSNAAPVNGGAFSYTVTVNNATSNTAATGVSIRDILPAGVTFVSASTTNGSYSSSTGLWTLASGVAASGSASLTINVTANATSGATITNWAEVWTSDQPDRDSTPGNNSTTEDDDASVNFTVGGARAAGAPPTLSCPIGSSVFDWDTKTWTAGSTSNSYAQTGFGQIAWNLSISGGSWGNIAALGGQNPALQNNGNTGGLSPVQYSLSEYADFTSVAGVATTTISLQTPIPGVQFRLFDVDYSAGFYTDKITVSGTVNGVSVTPVLTNGITNWVSGNIVVGDGQSANTSADGTVWVTFPTPVDTITLVYGNASTAPADPGTQAIAIHDLTMCNPQAGVKMVKNSATYNDGVNPLFNLPQTDVLYTLNISNDKSASLSNNSVFIVDPLPSQVTFFNGDADGGGPGATPVIFNDNGSGLTFNYATDVRYSNAAITPTSFAACTYTPTAGYDANVKHICINPKGSMLGQTSASTPGFTVTFRTRIN